VVGAARQLASFVALVATLQVADAQGAEALNVVGACRGGVPNGAYELHGKDGRVRAVGAFASGRKTGTFIFWTEGGARSAVIPYDNDARVGTVALWYTSARRELARRLEAPYSNNQLHGVLRSYHPNGAPRTECHYEHGRLVSAQAWDARGASLPEAQARALAVRDVEAENRLLAQFDATIGANLPRCE
jgi:hypothetical protein